MIRRKITHILASAFLIFSFPVSVFAQASPESTEIPAETQIESTPPEPQPAANPPAASPQPEQTTPGPVTTPGTISPTGADSTTYTYNESSGLWENPYYTWNPTTRQTSPVTPQEYSYNPETGKWDTTQWLYDAPTGKYVANIISTPVNPNNPSTLQLTNVSSAGPNSTNTLNAASTNSAYFGLFYDAKISNSLNQSATSGAAAVLGNTVGGDAISGNAIDVMNVINMLKSTFGLQQAADLMTFMSNINGDVVGDLYIDPGLINNQSIAVNNSNAQKDVAINASGSGLIDNDITLGADSGDATVDSNTTAGSAKSGNADAIANVVNMINSAIAANRSFLGVININGNLNGDILLPPNFIDQLIATNAPQATVTLTDSTNNNVNINSTNNTAVSNAVSLSAGSGDANIANNTNAGSATSGTAKTNLTIFNLTGQQVVAKNSILVFVNVLGQWVGLIMDAPTGTTAAAIGGSVTHNKTVNNNIDVNATTNNVIANNIKVDSQTGDAAVTNNTNAGDATSGNATASANIANIIDSQLSASDWFGLLFINVLGTWNGSFGLDTDAGTIFKPIENHAVVGAANASGNIPSKAAVFSFVSKPSQSVGGIFDRSSNNVVGTATGPETIVASSASSGGDGESGNTAGAASSSTSGGGSRNIWLFPAASFALVMLVTGMFGNEGSLTDRFHARLMSYRLRRG